MRNVRGVFVFVLCLIGLLPTQSSHVVAQADQDSEVVRVEGRGRVLVPVIQAFVRRCHCVVTYEDFKWGQDQVQVAPGLQRRSPDAPELRLPKAIPFTFTISRRIESQTSAQIASSLRELLAAYEKSGNVGRFRLVENSGAFHIIPATNALFDVPVTLAKGNWLLNDVFDAIATSVNRATGESMGLAGIASSFLLRTSVPLGGETERAGALLGRALAASGQKVTWLLLYDIGTRRYFLNIRAVQ